MTLLRKHVYLFERRKKRKSFLQTEPTSRSSLITRSTIQSKMRLWTNVNKFHFTSGIPISQILRHYGKSEINTKFSKFRRHVNINESSSVLFVSCVNFCSAYNFWQCNHCVRQECFLPIEDLFSGENQNFSV